MRKPRDWVYSSEHRFGDFIPQTRIGSDKKSQKKNKKSLDKQLNRCYNTITKNKESRKAHLKKGWCIP